VSAAGWSGGLPNEEGEEEVKEAMVKSIHRHFVMYDCLLFSSFWSFFRRYGDARRRVTTDLNKA
jgi:hypothetical protein